VETTGRGAKPKKEWNESATQKLTHSANNLREHDYLIPQLPKSEFILFKNRSKMRDFEEKMKMTKINKLSANNGSSNLALLTS
jgi:hypothetical protein